MQFPSDTPKKGKSDHRTAPVLLSALPDCALVRERQLLPVLPFSSPTLWRKIKRGQFPAPIRLDTGRITAWRWGDVKAWLDAQVSA